MHTTTRRAWNVPLGLGLFGAAVLVGGAILAYPEAKRAPSKVDVSDPIATRPFPSFPEEVPAVAGNRVNDPAPLDKTTAPVARAPSAVGGGPAVVEGDETTTRTASSAVPRPLPAPTSAPTTAATAPIAPTPIATTTTPLLAPAEAGVATPTTSEAGVAAEAGTTSVSDAAATMSGDAMATDYSTTPAIVPILGGGGFDPTGSGTTTSQTVPVSDGGLSIPSGGGGGGGGGGSSNSSSNTNDSNTTSAVTDAGVVQAATDITAPLLVPMSATSEPMWASILPHLRDGDVVINRDSAAIGFSDRVRTDAANVTYVVAFETPAMLQSSLDKLPATLPAVGVSAAGLSDAALTSLATKVHGTGRKLFISTNISPNGPSLAAIGQRADLVELVIASDVATTATSAIATIGSKTRVFVRLPDAAGTQTAVTLSQDIVAANPGAGIALPLSANVATYRR